MKKIIFRADGNKQTGLGHLYRVLALIEMYADTCDCTMVTRESSLLQAIPPHVRVTIIPHTEVITEEAGWLAARFLPSQHTIVADGYHFTGEYQKAIKHAGYRLFYIDDLAIEHMYADVVINHSLVAKEADYSKESYTRLALGAKYALLRQPFIMAAGEQRTVRQLTSVFVCFGGADLFGLTLKAVYALLKFGEIKKIVVVTGAAFEGKEMSQVAREHRHVQVHSNVDASALVVLMKSCDLAICPASTILYEVCAVKMPVIAGYYVENQKAIYEGAVKRKLIIDAGDLKKISEEGIAKYVSHALAEKDLQGYVERQAQVFDEHMKERFLMLLSDVTLRPAEAGDLLQIYTWANDEVARRNSYHQEQITMEQHEKWFRHKLMDPDAYIFIFYVDGLPAGMVRFDVVNDRAVVGILLDREFRGRGLAAQFLKQAAAAFFKQRRVVVSAYIKEENEASIRAFANAGYREAGKDIVHGARSVILNLEPNDI